MDTSLYTNPSGSGLDGNKIPTRQISTKIKEYTQQQLRNNMEKEKWQGKLLNERWKDDSISGKCFEWLKSWNSCSSHVIAGMHELYEQLIATDQGIL